MDIKRFEILPVLELTKLKGTTHLQISSVEVDNNDLYLGTVDSFIFYYDHILQQLNTHVHTCQPTHQKYLATKKPITQIRIASVLERLICVTDLNLVVLNLNNLELNANLRVKGVQAFCLNQNPLSIDPFSIELCLVRRKSIAIWQMQSDRFSMLREVNMSEQPILAAMDGAYVCVATERNYYMVEWQTGSQQLLCSNDATSLIKPICKHVAQNEFLINGLAHLGIFVKTSGISEKPPIDWGMDVQQIAFSYPYILCLKRFSIAIISVIDQKLKEEFMFENGVYIDNFDGKILIATNENVYYMKRIPWEEQIYSLLHNGKCQEALDLCDSLYESGLITKLDVEYAKLVKTLAGLVELNSGHFEQASHYLLESDFDITTLLKLYNSVEANVKFLSPNIQELNDSILDKVKVKISTSLNEFVPFFISYLKSLASMSKPLYTSQEVQFNTTLLLLYLQDAAKYKENIKQYLCDTQSNYDFDLVERHLQQCKLYHWLAMCYTSRRDRYEQAIDLWEKLESGQLSDSHYDGLCDLSELYIKCNNAQLILNHIEFILERNPNLGAQILIECTKLQEDGKFILLEPDFVVNLLHKYRRTLIIYLEHLVFQLNVKRTQIHNSLAILYIEIISIQRESEEHDSTFCENILQKLKNLLETSNHYDVSTVLKCLVHNGLEYESAYLYGKLGNHAKAFEIYVDKHMDHQQAMRHCALYAPKDGDKVYSILFGVYLDLYHKKSSSIAKPLLNFVNHSQSILELLTTIDHLPSEWTVSAVKRYLSKGVSQTVMDQYRTSMSKAMALSLLERIRAECRTLMRKSVIIDKDSVCIICNTKLFDSNFVWIPSSECYLHDYCYTNSVS